MKPKHKHKHEWVLAGFNYFVCRKCDAEASEREGYWQIRKRRRK